MGHRSAEHCHHPLLTPSAPEQLWYTRTAEQLTTPTDRLVVDIGCGQAPMAIELATVLPDSVRVLALDSDPEALAAAAANIEQAGLTGRVTLIKHDLTDGVDSVRDQLSGADLIWASSSLHHVGDQQRVVTELAGLLRDGGRLALAEGGLAERHLPWDVGVGEPGLELRLDAAQGRWFARMRADLPGSVPMPYGWSTALRKAGLSGIVTASAVFEEATPLTSAAIEAVLHDLGHRAARLGAGGFLDDSDRAAWEQLLDPASPVWLGHRDDLYSLTARTLYVGHLQS
ncbi:MAG: class I SAM-dependent methyltransferase [Actinomycetota bacterium]|nr:class I SAM-dependent methyltransferase [Actinomycetota bacterium]